MEEEIRLAFAQARKARDSGDFTTKQINDYIRFKTDGGAKDMQSMASLVGSFSEAVTVAETPNKIPRPLRGIAAGLQTLGQGVVGFEGGDELAGLTSQFGEGLRPGNTAESRREARRAGTEQSREGLAQFRKEHPVLAPALQIAGGIASGGLLAPLIAGAGSASVPAALLRGAGIGAAEGAAGGALGGETGKERLIGAGVGTALGGVLGGAAGTAVGAGARALQRFRLRGGGSELGRKTVTNVRTAIDGAVPATETTVNQLPGIINRARASTPKGEFKLAQLDLFEDLAKNTTRAIRGRLGLTEVTGEALSVGEELASSAPMLAVQAEIAGGRMVSSIARRIFGAGGQAESRALTNELNRILQSTDPKVIDKFVRQLLRAEPVLNSPLGTRFPIAPAAAAGGAAGGAINPLLDLLGQ